MKRNHEQILADVTAILKETGYYPEPEGKDAEPALESFTLNKDLGLDSIDLVNLVLKVENRFGCSMPERVYRKLNTIKDLIDYLEEHQNEH